MSSSQHSELRDFQLDTKFLPEGGTLHEYYVAGHKSGRRDVRAKETWQRHREIGNGTFGRVWLEGCQSGPREGQLRAVKEVAKGSPDSSVLEYERELVAMTKFSRNKYVHCFVESYGWYESANSIFIAMEYLEHGDLQKFLNAPLSENEARRVTRQLVEGIGFMHSNNFAHRDLKPANILVLQPGPDWWVKIGDLGISKRSEEGVTSLRSYVGTRGYLAPELIGLFPSNEDASTEAEQTSYTVAVDIWSLGEIAYRMVAAKPAFAEPRDLYNYVIKDYAFSQIVSMPDSLSADCRDFIERAMAPSAQLRLTHETAAEHCWLGPSRPSSRASSKVSDSASSHFLANPVSGTAITLTEPLGRWTTMASCQPETYSQPTTLVSEQSFAGNDKLAEQASEVQDTMKASEQKQDIGSVANAGSNGGPSETGSPSNASSKAVTSNSPQPRYLADQFFLREVMEPHLMAELIQSCTTYLEKRELSLSQLLPFQLLSDPIAVRDIVSRSGKRALAVEELPTQRSEILFGILRWCWSRIQSGLVGWRMYKLIKSTLANLTEDQPVPTFEELLASLPSRIISPARAAIIMNFFHIMTDVAAHEVEQRSLAINEDGPIATYCFRLAAWWVFDFRDVRKSFRDGLNSWTRAADATQELFNMYRKSERSKPPGEGRSSAIDERLVEGIRSNYATEHYYVQAQSTVDQASTSPLNMVERVLSLMGQKGSTVAKGRSLGRHTTLRFTETQLAWRTIECSAVLQRIEDSYDGETFKSPFSYNRGPSAERPATWPTYLASFHNESIEGVFWWVWMCSLANEEPVGRQHVFGSSVMVQSDLQRGLWIVIEEITESTARPRPVEEPSLRSRFRRWVTER